MREEGKRVSKAGNLTFIILLSVIFVYMVGMLLGAYLTISSIESSCVTTQEFEGMNTKYTCEIKTGH